MCAANYPVGVSPTQELGKTVERFKTDCQAPSLHPPDFVPIQPSGRASPFHPGLQSLHGVIGPIPWKNAAWSRQAFSMSFIPKSPAGGLRKAHPGDSRQESTQIPTQFAAVPPALGVTTPIKPAESHVWPAGPERGEKTLLDNAK